MVRGGCVCPCVFGMIFLRLKCESRWPQVLALGFLSWWPIYNYCPGQTGCLSDTESRLISRWDQRLRAVWGELDQCCKYQRPCSDWAGCAMWWFPYKWLNWNIKSVECFKMYRKAKIFFFNAFCHITPKPSENFPQCVDKLRNLHSLWFSDDNCPVEIKPASFQELVLLIRTGMLEKGIWLMYFHQTVVIKYKSSL